MYRTRTYQARQWSTCCPAITSRRSPDRPVADLRDKEDQRNGLAETTEISLQYLIFDYGHRLWFQKTIQANIVSHEKLKNFEVLHHICVFVRFLLLRPPPQTTVFFRCGAAIADCQYRYLSPPASAAVQPSTGGRVAANRERILPVHCSICSLFGVFTAGGWLQHPARRRLG